jgi:hypothetical protein
MQRWGALDILVHAADGFIICADGTLKDLSQQDHWDLT